MQISICYKNDYYLRNAKLNIYQCSTDKESDRLLRNKRQADEEPSSQYTTTPLFLESESSSLATITEENITTTEENSSEIDFTTTNTETSSALPLIDKNVSDFHFKTINKLANIIFRFQKTIIPFPVISQLPQNLRQKTMQNTRLAHF